MTGPATHWAARYIGRPWVAGVSDCWNFARRVWREVFDFDVPAVAVDAASPIDGRRAFRDGRRDGWHRVELPQEGDAILMSKGARPCHVGIWVNPDGQAGALHSVERSGVIWTPIARVADLGFQIMGYWRRDVA